MVVLAAKKVRTAPFEAFGVAFQIISSLQAMLQQKKSGSSKGGGQKKGAGSLADIPKPPEPWKDPEVIMENLLLVESFRRKVGRSVLLHVHMHAFPCMHSGNCF